MLYVVLSTPTFSNQLSTTDKWVLTNDLDKPVATTNKEFQTIINKIKL